MKDFHIHSGLIDHTYDNIFSIAKRAKKLGFLEITILEHISPFKIKYPDNSDPSNTIFVEDIPVSYPRRTSVVKNMIEECKIAEKEFGIKINKSLEVDYDKNFEKEIRRYLDLDIDYLTLSIHYIEDKEAEECDRFIHIGFEENMDKFLKKYGKEKMFKVYFESLLNGIRSGLFKYVAHLDFFSRKLVDYDFFEIVKYLDPVLEEIIAREMFLEINISGKNFQPRMEIIERYKQLGGDKLCLGSDSHSIAELEDSIEKRNQILSKMQVDFE